MKKETDTPFFGSDFGICVVHPSEIDKKWVPVISGNLMVKSKLPPWSGSSLGAVEPHPWKRAITIRMMTNRQTSLKHD